MNGTWVVLLEMARPAQFLETLEPERIREMVMELAADDPSALAVADRYALQLHVRAPNPADAITAAQSRVGDAIARLSFPPWELVRAEAVTLADYERECYEATVARRAAGWGPRAEPTPWCWWSGRLSSRRVRQRAAGRCPPRRD